MFGSPWTFELSRGTSALTSNRDAWDALATLYPSPYLTHAWLASWAEAYQYELVCATLRTADGILVAGALLRTVPGGYASGCDVDWDVVAIDEAARRQLWEELANLSPWRFYLGQLRVGSSEMQLARDVLGRAGYGVLPSVRENSCPYVVFPASFDDLLASRSRNARQQVRSRARQLDHAGKVSFRLTTGGPRLERDLESFLRVEASGWKGRGGTAIVNRPTRLAIYRKFVREAAERHWLRLHLLELDGEVIAGTLAIAIGGEGFFMKTGFDESWASLSPGSVLTAEVLRAAIDEGLRGMDMLGGADPYKMRWTEKVRPRQRLRVYRGPIGRAGERIWNGALRGRFVSLRDRAREDARLRGYLQRAQKMLER
jgi:CelD/BcsL family acetyltransferase involved in cellulose biosynthesis